MALVPQIALRILHNCCAAQLITFFKIRERQIDIAFPGIDAAAKIICVLIGRVQANGLAGVLDRTGEIALCFIG
jgi:hypothetical protein